MPWKGFLNFARKLILAIMNLFYSKLTTYYEIHRLSREDYTISQISREFVLNRRTVRNYLALDEGDYEQFISKHSV